jgi:hypothetical protein
MTSILISEQYAFTSRRYLTETGREFVKRARDRVRAWETGRLIHRAGMIFAQFWGANASSLRVAEVDLALLMRLQPQRQKTPRPSTSDILSIKPNQGK